MSDYDSEEEPLVNVAHALFAIARAIERLGTNGASGPMGAIELLACEVKRIGDEGIKVQIDDAYVTVGIADSENHGCPLSSIGEQLKNVAEAVRGNGDPWEP